MITSFDGGRLAGAGEPVANAEAVDWRLMVPRTVGRDTLTPSSMTGARIAAGAVAIVLAVACQHQEARDHVPIWLIAATLLAVSAWSITLSRLGMSNIATPALLGLGMWALCASLIWPATFWFLLSGVFLGLAMMTYVGSVAVIGAALALLAVRVYIDLPYRRAGAWPGAVHLPAGFVLAALPLLIAAHLDPAYYYARMSSVALNHEYADWAHFIPALLRNVGRHLLMFTVSGDQNGRHNLPGAPMLDPVTGSCFILGLGVAVRHLSRWIYQLLLLWLAAALSIRPSPSYPRKEGAAEAGLDHSARARRPAPGAIASQPGERQLRADARLRPRRGRSLGDPFAESAARLTGLGACPSPALLTN